MSGRNEKVKRKNRIMKTREVLRKEFKHAHPETVGESDKAFDDSNYIDWLENKVLNSDYSKSNQTVEDFVRSISYHAWTAAANAHRLYPENKHTFIDFWESSQEDINLFLTKFNPLNSNKVRVEENGRHIIDVPAHKDCFPKRSC